MCFEILNRYFAEQQEINEKETKENVRFMLPTERVPVGFQIQSVLFSIEYIPVTDIEQVIAY